MTRDAQVARSDLTMKMVDIQRKLEDLSDPGLKAFAAKIREEADFESPVETALWEGVAAAAEMQLALNKARASSKGKWFAAVERTIWEPNLRVGDGATLEAIECDGRDAAVEAGRELLRKYAEQWSNRVSIDVQLFPEIEWRVRAKLFGIEAKPYGP